MAMEMETQNLVFFTKIFLTFCEKKCSSDREKLLKFKAKGWEICKFPVGLSDLIN